MHARSCACLLIALAAACDSGSAPPPTPLERLERASLEPVELRAHTGGARTLRARVPIAAGSTLAEKADAFVDAYGEALGVSAAHLERIEEHVETGLQGTVVYRYVIEGLPVFGARLFVHVSASGEVTYVSGRLPEDDTLATTTPARTAEEAAAALAAAVGPGGGALTVRDGTLGVLQPGIFLADRSGPNRLAWRIESGRPSAAIAGYVDAATGEVAMMSPRIRTAFSAAVYDLGGGLDAEATLLTDAMLLATERGATRMPADPQAGALVTTLLAVHDWLFRSFGRDGHDGTGAFTALVHWGIGARCADEGECPGGFACDPYGDCIGPCGADGACPGGYVCRTRGAATSCEPYRNGAWLPASRRFAFTDGYITPGIVAHEVVHAIDAQGSSGTGIGEGGAVSEALADAMAAFHTGSWIHTYEDGHVVRDLNAPHLETDRLDNPAPRPRARSEYRALSPFEVAGEGNDFGHAHDNSGIPGYAIVLLTDGGTSLTAPAFRVEAIGGARAAQIIYRALTAPYVEPEETFDLLREDLLAACLDFVEGRARAPMAIRVEQCGSILEAFAAVGIGARDRDHDTRADDVDPCPDVPNYGDVGGARCRMDAGTQADGGPPGDAGRTDAGADAGPAPSYPPCPPTYATDTQGVWVISPSASSGPTPGRDGTVDLTCVYQRADGMPTTPSGRFRAQWIPVASDATPHLACYVASPDHVAVASSQTCSTASRQAAVQWSYGADGFEEAAELRQARAILRVVESLAAPCPTMMPTTACAGTPLACAPTLTLPRGTFRLSPGSRTCPWSTGTRLAAHCRYVEEVCELQVIRTGMEDFGTLRASWCEAACSSTSAECSGADVTSAGQVTQYSATHHAQVVHEIRADPGEESALVTAGRALLTSALDLRATSCP